MTNAEFTASVKALTAQVTKSKDEIVARVAALEAAVANAGNTTPETDAAFASLKEAVQGVDDLNVDSQA